MPFKENSVVRHRLRPDWGAGRVLLRSDEYLQIDFTEGGLKKLKTVIADEHLESATDEEVRALKPQKVKSAKRTIAAKTAIAPAAITPKTAIAAKTAIAPKSAIAAKTAIAPKSAIASKTAVAPKTAIASKKKKL